MSPLWLMWAFSFIINEILGVVFEQLQYLENINRDRRLYCWRKLLQWATKPAPHMILTIINYLLKSESPHIFTRWTRKSIWYRVLNGCRSVDIQIVYLKNYLFINHRHQNSEFKTVIDDDGVLLRSMPLYFPRSDFNCRYDEISL